MPITTDIVQKWRIFKESIEDVEIPYNLHSSLHKGTKLIDDALKEWRDE